MFLKCECCDEMFYPWDFTSISELSNDYYKYPTLRKHCRECFNKEKIKVTPINSGVCNICNSVASLSDIRFVDADGFYIIKSVCQSCCEFYKSCRNCGEISHYTNHLSYMFRNNTKHLCPSCDSGYKIRSKLTTCKCCGLLFLQETSSQSVDICDGCKKKYKQCDICSAYLQLDSFIPQKLTLYDNNKINQLCPQCSKAIVYCKSCGKSGHIKDMKIYSSNPVCIQCNIKVGGVVDKQKHDYKPKIITYHGTDPDNLFLGVENEVTLRDSRGNYNHRAVTPTMSRILAEFPQNYLYIKHDGSIGGEQHGSVGFEIVFSPHSFKEFKTSSWGSLFTPEIQRDTTCGMHIHLSKKAFTTYHLYKFLNFLYSNQNFVQEVGERKFTQYCLGNSKECVTRDAKIKYWPDKGPHDKYRRQMVNLCNPHTVELRFFANAASEETLFKNVEFVHALFKFTKDVGASESKSVSDFITFVKDNDKHYDNLTAFFNTNNL